MFGDLTSKAGLEALNHHLSKKTFIDGWTASQADVSVYRALLRNPGSEYPHVSRFYRQFSTYSDGELRNLPETGNQTPITQPEKKQKTEKEQKVQEKETTTTTTTQEETTQDGEVSKTQQKKDAKAKKLADKKAGKGSDEFAAEPVEPSTATKEVFKLNSNLTPVDIIKELFAKAIDAGFQDARAAGFEDIRVNRKTLEYQVNAALDIQTLKSKIPNLLPGGPQAIARKIISLLPKNDFLSKVGVTQQGFIMVELSSKFLHDEVANRVVKGVLPKSVQKSTVLVDFSSPNIAKEMHVGHLRSTIIGDTICRFFEFLGNKVYRVNHIGDWGTQFGMLLCYIEDSEKDFLQRSNSITSLTTLYKAAKIKFDEDPVFKKRSQERVVELQKGEPKAREIWKVLCDISRKEFHKLYSRLNVQLTEYGESFYNEMIPKVIEELEQKGLVEISDGAQCIFVEPNLPPLIVRKRDGGFNYDSTDMAALHYRIFSMKADTVIVITDVGQAEHFKLIYGAGAKAGWTQGKRVEHVGFGLVQDESGHKFKTRSGETVPLVSLLDEAVERMTKTLNGRIDEGKCPLTREEVAHAADVVGHASVKYFDLRQNPSSNYIFSYDKMLDDKGDTAVYLLYSRARIASILRKAQAQHNVDIEKLVKDCSSILKLQDETEIALAFELLQFHDILKLAIRDLLPNQLCKYLYDLCGYYSRWNNKCIVLGTPEMNSRLLLCRATLVTMDKCFELLGIKPLEKI